jgi:hypothetical protein
VGDVESRRAAYPRFGRRGFSVARLVQGAIDEMANRQVHMILYSDGSPDPDQRRLAIDARRPPAVQRQRFDRRAARAGARSRPTL